MLKIIATIFFGLFMAFSGVAQMELEVMSYNIRFANETDGENSWSKRKDHITNQLKFYKPDIFGVQEAVLEQLEHFKINLDGYRYLGVGRDDGKTKGEFSAIFYDSDQFDVLEEDTFWLSETSGVPSKGWDAAYPRVCTYGKFEEKNSGKKFWILNTHFDHVGEQARKESVKLIWEKIGKLNEKDLPVIFMGDLNLEPDTESIQFLSEKMSDSRKVSQNVVFGPEGTFNGYNFKEPVTRRIDYIFTDKEHIEVLKYAVLSDSKNLKYPSDHLPVLVELRL